jgi:hypothetical protein
MQLAPGRGSFYPGIQEEYQPAPMSKQVPDPQIDVNTSA